MSNNANLVTYGQKANATETKSFIKHILKTAWENEKNGFLKPSACIWGVHGIGKTALVKQIAKEEGCKFKYIAPAQFEEMGDLLGMPKRDGNKTTYLPPEWVPTEECKGVLLLDDANRSDGRILNGVMQLIQNYELATWSLPKGWVIIMTANPDGGDYSVTPIDAAQLTRSHHITMNFEPKVWARWAEQNGVDERVINWVLTHPELLNGDDERTNARSVTAFARTISGIKDLSASQGLAHMLAESSMGTEASTSFMAFIQQNLTELVSPETIVNTTNFKIEVEQSIRKSANVDGSKRIDILATLTTRFVNYLSVNNIQPNDEQLENIKSFIKLDFIPNDQRLSMAQDLVSSENTALKVIVSDREIGNLLLKRM